MGNKPAIAKMERVVDVREIWKDEAKDFTPWLASDEGLDLLSGVIGFGLDLVKTEVQVGPYFADILAQSKTEEDHKVVVENQLNKTDHDHLGKAITYAANLGARTLIWISGHFTEEHREALDWLNHNTNEELAFWGLEIQAFHIGSSLPAPFFNVVSGPNPTSKRAQAKSQSTPQPSEIELMACASKHHVDELVMTLRKLGPPDEYVSVRNEDVYGGSFTCWRKDLSAKPRMVLGINVSGERKNSPDGKLDIWLRIKTLSDVTGMPNEEIQKVINQLPIFAMQWDDLIIRLNDKAEAEKTIETLRSLFVEHPGVYGSQVQ